LQLGSCIAEARLTDTIAAILFDQPPWPMTVLDDLGPFSRTVFDRRVHGTDQRITTIMSQSVSQSDSHSRGRYRVDCVCRQAFEELSVCRNHREALAVRSVALLSDRDRARRMVTAGFDQWRIDRRSSASKERLSETLERVAGPL